MLTKIREVLCSLIALGILLYVVYSLAVLKNPLTVLHVILVALSVIILLADRITKFSLLNLLNYESKIEDYKNETVQKIAELKYAIDNQIVIHSMPKQNVVVNIDKKSITEIFESNTGGGKENETGIKEDTKKHIASIKDWIYHILLLTREFQIATNEDRLFNPKDLAIDIGIISFDERTTYLAQQILDNGLDKLKPKIMVVDGKEQKEAFDDNEMKTIREGLDLISWLYNIDKDITANKIIKESKEELDIKIDKIRHAMYMLGLILGLRASLSINYQNEMTRKLSILKIEIEDANKENRPIRLPDDQNLPQS